MNRRINWPVIIPVILTVYLAVMAWLGWPSYRAGLTSPLLYFGGTALVLACIVLLHFHMKKRLRQRRSSDKTNQNKQS